MLFFSFTFALLFFVQELFSASSLQLECKITKQSEKTFRQIKKYIRKNHFHQKIPHRCTEKLRCLKNFLRKRRNKNLY